MEAKIVPVTHCMEGIPQEFNAGHLCMHPLCCCAFYFVCHFTNDELT